MPIYEFCCQECNEHIDKKLPMKMLADDYIFLCPHCGKAAYFRRVYTTFALRIKKGPTEKLGEDIKI